MSFSPRFSKSSRLRIEVLEDRRVLEAVGLFERVDLPGFGTATGSDIIGTAAWPGGFDLQSDADEVFSTVTGELLDDDGDDMILGSVMNTANVMTPVGGDIPVPQVSTASTVEMVVNGNGNVEALGTAAANATYTYDVDPMFTAPFMLEGHMFLAASDINGLTSGDAQIFPSYTMTTQLNATQVGGLGANATVQNGVWTINAQLLDGPVQVVQGATANWHYRFRVVVNSMQDLQLGATTASTNSRAWGGLQGGVANSIVNLVASSWAFVWPIGMAPVAGDFNVDGAVDAADLELWQNGSPLSDADLDGVVNIEGVVTDLDDLAIWVANANPTDLAAWAATTDILLVSSDGDAVDSNETFGNFTLREAIARAATLSGPNVIMVGNGVDEITLTNGALTINNGNNITLIGPGADSLTISGNNSSRVFSIGSGAEVSISKVTLTEGFTTAGGGAIYNLGHVTLDKIRATHNESTTDAGALLSGNGSLMVSDSTFDSNSSGRNGGAVHGTMSGGHQLTIQGSTFSNNTAVGDGGAIYLYGSQNNGDANIVNSTVSGNTASNGAGIHVTRRSSSSTDLYATVINCTITDNHATGTNSVGGGLRTGLEALVTMHNSIVAGNSAGTSGHGDITGVLESPSSYNVIGEANGGVSGAAGAGNQFNVTDPGLGSLADNGGPTWTHELLSTSPALDAGSDSIAPATDQRGNVRPIDLSTVTNGAGGSSDIGAYEAEESSALLMAREVAIESEPAPAYRPQIRSSYELEIDEDLLDGPRVSWISLDRVRLVDASLIQFYAEGDIEDIEVFNAVSPKGREAKAGKERLFGANRDLDVTANALDRAFAVDVA